VYWVSSQLAGLIQLDAHARAELLVAAPKLLQACIAATGDYYTWKLGERVYGQGSRRAWATLALSACSAWQWFCSTRTLSNCLETTLTIVALESWPWAWSKLRQSATAKGQHEGEEEPEGVKESQTHVVTEQTGLVPDVVPGLEPRLRRSLLFAALACILRPTNVLIWACLAGFTLLRGRRKESWTLITQTAVCGQVHHRMLLNGR
jgi:phosphatidylinositol glycan class B